MATSLERTKVLHDFSWLLLKVGFAADSAGRWYEVSDAPPGEKDAAGWQRVLAVFVQGKDWQFRGWPFKARGSHACCRVRSSVHQL